MAFLSMDIGADGLKCYHETLDNFYYSNFLLLIPIQLYITLLLHRAPLFIMAFGYPFVFVWFIWERSSFSFYLVCYTRG